MTKQDYISQHVRHCKRHKYDVYVGRGSKWGNSYKIGVDGTREEVIEKYQKYFDGTPELWDVTELKDKVLGCYCYPLPCHAEILAGEVWEKFYNPNPCCGK